MTIEDELASIDNSLAKLEFSIQDMGVQGAFVDSREEAEFRALRIEAKTILDGALGMLNNFSTNLLVHSITGSSLGAVRECRAVIQAAIRQIRRGTSTNRQPSSIAKLQFVDVSRLAALRTVKSAQWDLTRLIRLCEELNIAYSNDCYMSVAMLVRAILDHIPPLLGKQNFAEVANNFPGPSSFKKSMSSLQLSLRNIADAHLHLPIRQKEVLPTIQQIDFYKDLDVLLGEIVRTLK